MKSVCPQCARRTWLLAKLGVRLDFRARDLDRFWSLLELSDRDLIEAIGGRRRADLHEAYEAWEPVPMPTDKSVESLCKHHPVYPSILRGDPLAPHTLYLQGGMERLTDMLNVKVVAIVGTRRPTDYGMEVARGLACGLAASGVTVASGFGEGIPSAVQAGVLEAHSKPLSVIAGNLTRCSPVWCTPLHRRVVGNGCAISELQPSPDQRIRAWWRPGSVRTLALLAQLTIVVEAGEHPRELACARVTSARGRDVAAVPGRVSSPASKGTNALLMNGGKLVRGIQDALDVLYGADARPVDVQVHKSQALGPRLARVLEQVSRGQDTLAKLTTRDAKPGDLALALTELELRGLLLRGDGARYLPSTNTVATRA